MRTVTIPGHQPKEGEDMNPVVNIITPGFFETIQLPVLLGRGSAKSDNAAAVKVTVVNEDFARQFFPRDNPIGRKLHFGRTGHPLVEIVGVVKTSKHGSLRELPQRLVYIPVAQEPDMGSLTFYIRSTMDPAAAGAAIRREVARLDANLPVTDVRTIERQIAWSLIAERMVASLSSVFGLLATVLAAIGLYGVRAVAVARRTREIGIRMALGAYQGSVVWLVMREALVVTAAGLAAGIPLALAGVRMIESQLFGVGGVDIAVVAGSIGILVAAASLAGYLPARRATAIDPIQALRYDG
jgi:predicted permease